jgi:hypothetical protein
MRGRVRCPGPFSVRPRVAAGRFLPDHPAQDQPVRGRGGQRRGHPDLQHGDQADLPAGRAHRGQAAVAQRAAGEGRGQAGHRTRRGARDETPQRRRLGGGRGHDPDGHDAGEDPGQVGHGHDGQQQRPAGPGASGQRGQHREGREHAQRRAGRRDDGAGPDGETRAEQVGHGPDDGVGGVGHLGEQQQRRPGGTGRQRAGRGPELGQVDGQGSGDQQGAGGGQQGSRGQHAQHDRPRARGQQARQPRPGGQPAQRAEAARDQGKQERGDERLPQRRRGLCRPAGHGQRPGEQRVGQGQGDRGVAGVPEPGHRPGAHHPPAGQGEQRAGNEQQAEREHADPPGAVDRDAHVVRDEPQHRGGAQHAGQAGAQADVRGGDPADRGHRGQHGQAAGRRRAGGDGPRDDQRARGPGRRPGTRPGPGPLRGGRGLRVVRVARGRCFGGNTHKPDTRNHTPPPQTGAPPATG